MELPLRIARAALLCAVALAVGVALVSGGSDSGPRTPAALPGLPPPFLGTAVSGGGGLTAAVDAYGDVVDLRGPGPAGAALIHNPAARQAAGTVAADTGIVPRVAIGGGPPLPMWRADSVAQRYLAGTNVVRTVARFGRARVVMTVAAAGGALAVMVRTRATGARTPAARGRTRAARGRTRAAGGRTPATGTRMRAADISARAAEASARAASGPTGADAGAPRPAPSLTVNVAGEVRCASEARPARLTLLCRVRRAKPATPSAPARPSTDSTLYRHMGPGVGTVARGCAKVMRTAVVDGRRWLGRSRPLGAGAPAWGDALYRRSLLVVHALTSRATGAVAAGARDGWAYVWPRDAAGAALALAAAGHPGEARHVARFLTGLDLAAAARFGETGAPVPGRAAQGDAAGWVDAAARATGLPPSRQRPPWRARADYQESTPGNYLGNALAAVTLPRATPANAHPPADGPKTGHMGGFSAHRQEGAAEVAWIAREFGTPRGLVRSAGDPGSGLDPAAGWAVRPFGLRPLYPAAEATLRRLAGQGTRYGITPGEGWGGGEDPWSAPTAWSAWALAGLAAEGRGRADRRAALALLGDLRRAATPAGDLPERVGVRTGVPTSTTPLLWSSAFTILALRELWP